MQIIENFDKNVVSIILSNYSNKVYFLCFSIVKK